MSLAEGSAFIPDATVRDCRDLTGFDCSGADKGTGVSCGTRGCVIVEVRLKAEKIETVEGLLGNLGLCTDEGPSNC